MLVLAVTYSHNTVEVGGTHAQTVCVRTCVCKGEVDVEPTEISPLHH